MSDTHSHLTDKHVVVLINYMRKHHVLTFKEIARTVRKLTILVSTKMESDRSWTPDWGDLDVIVQKNSTLTLNRSSGFQEKNFIHIPWDSIGQLRKLKPDVVLSYEMGARTLLSGIYRKLAKHVPVVMIGNMTHHIEQRRGSFRNTFRNIIRKSVDLATYNGPSCKRYLQSIGFDHSKLVYFPYCFDPGKTFQGQKSFSSSGVENLLYCGALSDRKAILPFTLALQRFCRSNPDRTINFFVAGNGPHRNKIAELNAENLNIELVGECGEHELRDLYSRADVCVFPTLSDEWGLVPMEAWASGVPVLGSKYAQSVEANCRHGINGWVFDTREPDNMDRAVGEALATTHQELREMSAACRRTVEAFSPTESAKCLQVVIQRAIGIRSGPAKSVEFKHEMPQDQIDRPRSLATLSLDLDNKWSYLKSHNDPAWESHPGYLDLVVPRILSSLDELGVKITFFVVGQDAVIEENASALRMISDHGHEIANHSFHHEPCLHAYTPEQLDQELGWAEENIKRVTGQRTVGFRGPGFSLSDQTLNTLVRRGYKYDCTMFPTYLSPLARTYYFMSGSFTRKQVKEKQALFGKFSDGFMPNHPYLWQTEFGDLLEIPVTTYPGIKSPIHATYLHFLATYSVWAADKYLSSALGCCRLAGIAPSLLLHPLDFMGADDAPDLSFFPAMNIDSKTKIERMQKFLQIYCQKFEVVTMQEFATMTLAGNLNRHSISLARTGAT